MPSVDVVDLNNAVVGTLDLSDEVFGAPRQQRPAV